MTPTQRTMNALRKEGWRPSRVDCNNGRRGRDAWDIIDIMAMRDGDVIAIQVTGGSGNGLKRVRKCEGYEDVLADMRKCKWTIEVHEWVKLKSGWRCKRWDLS